MQQPEIQAIDVHGHYGKYTTSPCGQTNAMMSATAQQVVELAKIARTCLTLVSPFEAISPYVKNDAVSANKYSATEIPQVAGLRYWVVIDARKPETFSQAAEMLRSPACVGIKLHPTEHGYRIAEHGDKIFEFAAEHRAIVLSHTGQKECMPEEYVNWANRFPEMKLILAHLGLGAEDDDSTHHVRAIQHTKKRNVYVDTAGTASLTNKLLEWAVEEIGVDRILYGTDVPCYFSPMVRARIDYSDLKDEQKTAILRNNALDLFGSMGKVLL